MILNISTVGTMIPLPPSISTLEFWEQLQENLKMLLWLLITQLMNTQYTSR